MPVYKKGKGSYRVVIFHRGERQDFTIRGTRADAEAFEARQRAKLEAGDALQGSRIAPRFFDFCASDYKPHARMQLRKSTWSVRVFHLATLCTHFGNTRLTEIDGAAVERFKLARHEAGRSPVTINNEIAVLQAVLTFARRIGVPAANPKYLFLRTTKSSRAKAWSSDEVARLYAQCGKLSPEVLPLVIFLANTGARPTEALRLEWRNVDLDLGFIRIWPSEEWRPKDDEAREVPISDELRAMLEAIPRTSSFVFPTAAGERRKSFPKYPFERARDAAKITGGHAPPHVRVALLEGAPRHVPARPHPRALGRRGDAHLLAPDARPPRARAKRRAPRARGLHAERDAHGDADSENENGPGSVSWFVAFAPNLA